MSGLFIRRFCLAALVILAYACSDQSRDGYTWQKTSVVTHSYRWHVVGREAIKSWCGDDGVAVNACVIKLNDVCHVYSTFTEDEARRFKPAGTFGGTSLFEHEVWDDQARPTLGHCAGFSHKEPYLVYSRLY